MQLLLGQYDDFVKSCIKVKSPQQNQISSVKFNIVRQM